MESSAKLIIVKKTLIRNEIQLQISPGAGELQTSTEVEACYKRRCISRGGKVNRALCV